MSTAASVFVLIPALNEEASIGKVIAALPRSHVQSIVVADNNSTDRTADVARSLGAVVVPAPVQGYGAACLAAIAYVDSLPSERRPRVICFIDADFSDDPAQLPLIVEPVLRDEADLVIGSRMLKRQPPGALLPQAVFGNRLACFLLRLLYGARFTDLGPFRAIGYDAIKRLKMRDTNYGWTVEMQLKAARQGLRFREVPVDYRPRIGQSKITGTLAGSVRAGYKILFTIFRYALSEDQVGNPSKGTR